MIAEQIAQALIEIEAAILDVPKHWTHSRCVWCEAGRPFLVTNLSSINDLGAVEKYKVTGICWKDPGWVEVSKHEGDGGGRSAIYCPRCAKERIK